MGMDLNNQVKPQAEELTKKGVLFSNKKSMHEQPYPSDKVMSTSDKLKLLFNAKHVIKCMSSLNKSIQLIKETENVPKNNITAHDFEGLTQLMNELKIGSWGFLEIDEQSVFSETGIPFKNALVITIAMNKEIFNTAPSMEAQIEVMKVYGETGIAVNIITKFLRKKGYNAAPNHSMGGNIDYCKAGMNAGLGYIGKHGMLMTPENGACHRSAVVYTDIKNLNEFVPPKNDHSWIKEFCKSCGKCAKKCPTKAILNNPKIDEYGNVTSIDYDKCCAGFKEYGCGICIKECPFTKVGYAKIYESYKRKLNHKKQ